jgi:hypothetical protein
MRGRKLQSVVTPSGYHFDPKKLYHWCFDDCPEEEIYACWHYEFLRDCPQNVERVLEWRKANPGWEDPVRYIDVDPYERLIKQWPWRYERLMAEWPQQAYLDIDPKVRQLHLTIKGVQSEWFYRGLREGKDRKPLAWFPVYDWTLSETALTRQFRQFLKDERPKDIDIHEPRGHRKMRSSVSWDLEALGAYRLSLAMSQCEAVLYMQRRLDHPPYKNQSALSKAVKRVTAALAWFESSCLAEKLPRFS